MVIMNSDKIPVHLRSVAFVTLLFSARVNWRVYFPKILLIANIDLAQNDPKDPL